MTRTGYGSSREKEDTTESRHYSLARAHSLSVLKQMDDDVPFVLV